MGRLMSALGQKRTLRQVRAMCALPPKADIDRQLWNVRFVCISGQLEAPEGCPLCPCLFNVHFHTGGLQSGACYSRLRPAVRAR